MSSKKSYKSAPKVAAPVKNCSTCRYVGYTTEMEPCNKCYESLIPFLPKWEKK